MERIKSKKPRLSTDPDAVGDVKFYLGSSNANSNICADVLNAKTKNNWNIKTTGNSNNFLITVFFKLSYWRNAGQ